MQKYESYSKECLTHSSYSAVEHTDNMCFQQNCLLIVTEAEPLPEAVR